MLAYFINWLRTYWDIPGGYLINYKSVQGILAVILSLVLTLVIGKRIIQILRKKQISDEERNLGLAGSESKKSTPTMGGIMMIIAICITILLLGDLKHTSIQLLLFSVVWFGMIGFLDDYIKVFKKNKAGLPGKYKVVGQFVFAVIMSLAILKSDDLRIERAYIEKTNALPENVKEKIVNGKVKKYVEVQAYITTIPFIKKHEFNYQKLLPQSLEFLSNVLYIFIISFIIIAVSNAANLTDGIDGNLAGISIIIGMGLAVFAYVSSNINLAEYLNILYIPYASQIFVICLAMIGACIGFLWFNAFPAQVFMGDTGSLCIGGLIASIAILIRKELLIPMMCGVFFIEALSVTLQVSYFKYTKKKYGEGRRIFLMSPIHHHYQKKGIHENKIVVRFWIISILLVSLSLLTLKIR